jgi:hypothetical protein
MIIVFTQNNVEYTCNFKQHSSWCSMVRARKWDSADNIQG